MSGVWQNIDRFAVVFDDESLVADGGLLAAATLWDRLGSEALVDETVRLGGRVGGANPGRKVLSVAASMLSGGSHIDHVDRLRAGSTDRVLPFEVAAPSTVGVFLRSFTWGHVRQLEKALTETLGRAWGLGAGPGEDDLTLDLDSTICEVSGKGKGGASYGYTKQLGYHPLLGFRADTGEAVAARLREGSSQRGVVDFARETVGRARRAGAVGGITVRADSGFWSYDMFRTLDDLGVGWSVTTPLRKNVVATIEDIDEDAWTPIAYTRGGEAQVAETVLRATNPAKRKEHLDLRLVVRRSRLTGAQRKLWPDWRHHAFVTNLNQPTAEEADRHHHTDPDPDTDADTADAERRNAEERRKTVEADRYHRAHAVCELAIRDQKESAGLAHLPSGVFAANAAWLLITALAHNTYRWIPLLAGTRTPGQLTTGKSIRRRLFGIPARLVNHGGKHILRLPARWPWATTYLTTLANLRALPQLC